jgi:hypothetical protein
MTVYSLDPLTDSRWAELVERHPSSSVFHSVPWLKAIQRTYGYKPVVYSTSPASAPLSNGVVFCEVKSWLTGRRLVSLPFSDHCEPLLDSPEALTAIGQELKEKVDRKKWKYIEIRPTTATPLAKDTAVSLTCFLHTLDLTPNAEEIFRRTHKTSIQQTIKRSEREGVDIETGSSERLLSLFYGLMVKTRRRHQVPPQPIEWFRNLTACMGDRLRIRVASHRGEPIASTITLEHKNALFYKYGASDDRFNSLGATPSLIWKAIVEGKSAGQTRMDFGRSELDNQGLIKFKDRWGATASKLTYLRWSSEPAREASHGHASGLVKRVFGIMPDFVLQTTGRILYRHIG